MQVGYIEVHLTQTKPDIKVANNGDLEPAHGSHHGRKRNCLLSLDHGATGGNSYCGAHLRCEPDEYDALVQGNSRHRRERAAPRARSQREIQWSFMSSTSHPTT
uniref:Uncharacterized protein n=1 Tax=Setaria viridis TaxID=4556 RepID=A0A4U6V6L9_SETVI|nr:hypothetical protein SEVIR_3G078133v2 [Setaria viridis]